MKDTAAPPTISVKKCAPTTTLLKAITEAILKKKYFNLGKKNDKTTKWFRVVLM